MGEIVRQQNFYIVGSSSSFALDATDGDMIVFVGCAGKSTNSASYINVCTYNAVTLSLTTFHRVTRSSVDIWVMVNPPAGSHTLAYSGSGLTMAGTAFVLAGMAQSGYELAEDTVVPASASLATHIGSYCFAGFSGFASPVLGAFAGTNGTIETQEVHNASHGSNHWAGYLKTLTNPDIISMSGAGGSYQSWAAVSLGANVGGSQAIWCMSKIYDKIQENRKKIGISDLGGFRLDGGLMKPGPDLVTI